ncbi:MAG TPA: undecaprenyldiphospho-muramoylpentapeptide beta-N-acetylglucosaminyltransferase [Rhodospirillaceae bacterium]|nr:undecaprenyldiphospho-muramoylpentapeptide beta-N-acetylglucosaminyltransferase [Rhodospirillaceae bacterium]HAT35895.1 undecaprenyldiphospho-muramoylpentapeptide beta-N-acetylglucosaminyltransferase [Rhodospirillaceae bacterium]
MSGHEKMAVLAAGGTGGHLFPARALADELSGHDVRLTLITDRRAAGISGALANLDTYRIHASGVSGRNIFRRLFATFSLGIGFIEAALLLRRLKPDVVIGFGSYASVPTVAAAALLGYRTVIHEQNAILGRANRFLAPRVTRIATAFEFVANLRAKDRQKAVWTGNPVRPDIIAIAGNSYPAVTDDQPIQILIFGGSQGASVFSDVVPDAMAMLPKSERDRLRIVQQCREEDIAAVEAAYRKSKIAAEIAPFFDDIADRISAAHLVICRAGASTLAEIATAGRPAILVPFPHAIDDHQTRNAQGLCDAGGGWMIPQDAFTPETLANRLKSLFSIERTLETAAQCATKISMAGAAERLAKLVIKTLGPDSPDPSPKGAAA